MEWWRDGVGEMEWGDEDWSGGVVEWWQGWLVSLAAGRREAFTPEHFGAGRI